MFSWSLKDLDFIYIYIYKSKLYIYIYICHAAYVGHTLRNITFCSEIWNICGLHFSRDRHTWNSILVTSFFFKHLSPRWHFHYKDKCFIGLALTQFWWFLPQMIVLLLLFFFFFFPFFPAKYYSLSVNHETYAVEILL